MIGQQPTCRTSDGVPVIAYPNGECPPGSYPIATNGGDGTTPVTTPSPGTVQAGFPIPIEWILLGVAAWFLLKGNK